MGDVKGEENQTRLLRPWNDLIIDSAIYQYTERFSVLISMLWRHGDDTVEV